MMLPPLSRHLLQINKAIDGLPCWLLTHLRHRLLAATAAHTHAVHHVSLLCLKAHAAGLIGPARAGQANNAGQLPILPATHAQEEAEDIALLLLPKLFNVLQ